MEKIEEEIKKIRFRKNLTGDEVISFFDWECPPRRLKRDKDGQIWFDFNLPLEKIVEGKKVDEFTELPKLLTKERETKEILQIIEKMFNKAQFLKLVADTNWLYLYPETLERIGEKRLVSIAKQLERLLQKKADQIFGKDKVKIMNFTKLQKKFKREYEKAFNEVLDNFEEMVPCEIKNQWEVLLISHVGFSEKQRKYREALAKRTVASYAAEGIVFALLDKAKILPNPVWISMDEPLFTGETTEILRKRRGIAPLPKIFLVR